MAHQYANALIANKQLTEATRYLREQSQLYRQDAQIQELLAKAYAAQGRQALQHMALAEFTEPAACQQLLFNWISHAKRRMRNSMSTQ